MLVHLFAGDYVIAHNVHSILVYPNAEQIANGTPRFVLEVTQVPLPDLSQPKLHYIFDSYDEAQKCAKEMAERVNHCLPSY